MSEYEVIDREGLGGTLIKHDSTKISRGVSIDISEKVVIGKNVMVCEDVLILTHDHDKRYFMDRGKIIKSPLVIEDNVFIGARSIILPGCNLIREGTFIGAGSVVTKDTKPDSIYAGNPAQYLGWKSD
jgi:maltose O-acetyltransferase